LELLLIVDLWFICLLFQGINLPGILEEVRKAAESAKAESAKLVMEEQERVKSEAAKKAEAERKAAEEKAKAEGERRAREEQERLKAEAEKKAEAERKAAEENPGRIAMIATWSNLSVKALKSELQSLGIDCKGCTEKGDLVLLLDQHDTVNRATKEGPTLPSIIVPLLDPAKRAILDALESAFHVGGLPPNIPSKYLMEWTQGLSFPLGEGGFGKVYRGAININGVVVPIAVKQLSSKLQLNTATTPGEESDLSKALEKSVKSEVNSLSNFRHLNVIRLLGFSLPEKGMRCTSDLFIVYELAEGGDLAFNLTHDAKARSLTWKMRIIALLGVAKALWCLHSQRIYHRDIKSANIALTGNGSAKIIDWGLAKYIPKASDQALSVRATTAGGASSFGTPGYQCPLYV